MSRVEEKKKKYKSVFSAIFLIFCSIIYIPNVHSADLPDILSESDYHNYPADLSRLGQLLFFDSILSGNRNISCATCHSPDHGSSDGLSLGIGEGGEGISIHRTGGKGDTKIKKRISRNAPGLWNLGAKQIDVLFHDGRITRSDIYENGFNTPAQERLPKGLKDI